MLLSHQHPVTDLLIKLHYDREGPLGVNHVLAELNKEFCTTKGRSTVKRVVKKCVPGRFWKAGIGTQQMGDLPPARIQRSQPFTIIGIDLMGPIMVGAGRSSVKRYICIFNCLATRTVHLR